MKNSHSIMKLKYHIFKSGFYDVASVCEAIINWFTLELMTGFVFSIRFSFNFVAHTKF